MRPFAAILVVLALILSVDAQARKRCRGTSPASAGAPDSVDARGPDAGAPGAPAALPDPSPSEQEPRAGEEPDAEEDCTVSRRRNECAVVTRQIAHFEDVLEMARDRDNELWERATEDHIDRLQQRRERFCPPEPSRLAAVANALADAALVAARLAATAFTMGAF